MSHTNITYKKSTFYFYVLLLAGFYNILWGAWVILFPELSFSLHKMPLPRYLEIWQCVGMIVGVYGVGYIAASSNPLKHWPIVLVGFLGKVFGPLGFIKALVDGVFPISFMVNIVFNDLIWWVPFFMILKDAYRGHLGGDKSLSIDSLNLAPKSIVVALRHQGCTFTRENLEGLNHFLPLFNQKGYKVYILHMSTKQEIEEVVSRYLEQKVEFIEDPQANFYRGLGLSRASFFQAFGWTEFSKGVLAFLNGHGLGPLRGDGFQLGGVFKIENSKITKSIPTARASEKYNFEGILS